MGTFKDSLKKWFYTNSSSAASTDARIPLLTSTGDPKGSDTMENLASVLGVKYPNIPLFVDTNDDGRLVRIYKYTVDYAYAITKIVCRDTGSNNRLEINVIFGEKNNIFFEKITGKPTSVKFYKDDTYLYVLFPKYNSATITYVGGNIFNTSSVGGIIMPSADVSGLTEVVVP